MFCYNPFMSYSYLGKEEGGSPRSEETELKAKVDEGVVISSILKKPKEPKKPKTKPKPKPKPIPSVTENLPFAWRKSRKLYPKEIAYAKKIYGDSIDYDKVKVTRDHWFAKGSTKVTGNTINFTSNYGSDYLFEDTPEQQLNEEGLLLLGHEIGHVWQFQNGGWAYAENALLKQAAGFYSTGSRNTAYDYQTAIEWDIPWENWGPEQQAEAIDQWNHARHKKDNPEVLKELQVYVDKARRGEGATQFSIPGTIVTCAIASGIGYIIRKTQGATCGLIIGVLINLPWNGWAMRKKRKKLATS